MQKHELARVNLLNRGEKNNDDLITQRVLLFRLVAFILLSIVILSGLVVAGWFAGEMTINQFFAQIYTWQMNPPMWLEAPMIHNKYLLSLTLALLVTMFAVMKLSPQPRVWSQRLVVGILIILTVRYLLWRSLSTFNLADPLNGTISLSLFALEIVMISSSLIELFLMLNIKERHREADEKSLAVINGEFTPSVDIFIPTYNEPEYIVRRTIMGCQALNYPQKNIYLLDDNRRTEMGELAVELGCNYISRPNNQHAKAGNLNNALTQTSGELIAVFDADFVPTTNFLLRTVGFFQDETIAIVQTPQSFYNADPVARNLGLENILTPDEEVFHRHVQSVRDNVESAICAGTSFVMRRAALEKTGGFVTESLSEDYFTGVNLAAYGYRIIYLNELLSAGLAAENIAAYATQRLRWAQGTLQGLFIQSNPLILPGLTLTQRLAHLGGFLSWFANVARISFLLMPLAYSFLGVIPIRANLPELIYFWLPLYVVNLAVFAWLNKYSRSAFLSDIYFLVLCFPVAWTVIQSLLRPFGKGFKVTPKGLSSDHYTFNWKLALPLIILFIATAISLWQNLCMSVLKQMIATQTPAMADQTVGVGVGWLWSIYNLIMIGSAILVFLDAPKTDKFEWFDLRRVVELKIGSESFWGVTTMMSEIGAEIALTQQPPIDLLVGQTVQVKIAEENLQLTAGVVHQGFANEFPIIRLHFELINISQHRHLVEILFCRPGQWKRQNAPGELISLWLILRILLKPRFIFNRKIDVSPVVVAKV
ncbi:UDP-glucose-beta-D-glucan glucosyltransferase [Nostoc piscinale CENA21]|uniref:UDP-glucose-beta-D-glucan glucosyltransferase n=1 Tax=Nostoc piscinale CENA21 TaxID=224013 RepID=A0A0M4TIC9_9NOSO|nr:glycosyltransferase [Nostoc piscinale]ALF52286.1 UDP-glucose-beta-D-glucan glucosyltransferase [Nostoc piscinale CENA21]